MAYISDGVLAAAMSHAGCAGVIGSGGFTPDEVQSHIRRFKDIAGSQKVYGVNLMLQDDNKDDIAQIICDEKVPFVTIGAGNPIPWFEPFHQKGIKCIPVVPNVKLAQRVQAHGADALVVEGMEAGGHDGKLTLMALLENVLPDIEIPVIAAGGIADGRGVAAAFMLGAVGVPVLANFSGGIDKFVGPTGGFLISFPLMAYIIGLGVEHRNAFKGAFVTAVIVGTVVNYVVGVAMFVVVAHSTIAVGITACVLPFIPTAIIKAVLACAIGLNLRKRIPGLKA